MRGRNTFIIANIVVIILVVGGFAGMQLNEFSYYKEVATDQAMNDVELTAIDINSQISNISTEQRVASQMMANDIFLKAWCEEETADADSKHAEILYSYLDEYKEKYDYDVVFFVSNKTYNYYYDGGLNKVVSPDDDFDVWYFNFLNLNREYDIQIDHDEVNDFNVSLFVNCLVTSDDGEILGVVGCGNIIDDFQASLTDLISNYAVEISIVNVGNAHNSFTGSSGYYNTVSDASDKLGISEDEVTRAVGDDGFTWQSGDDCYSLRHNKELNWNIIVKKNITDFVAGFLSHIRNRVGFLAGLILAYIIVSFSFLLRIDRYSRRAQNTDDITGLINNRLFKEEYEKYRKKSSAENKTSLIVLDVDDFKSFNDSYGHIYGNTVLRLVANELKNTVGDNGTVARWGGDEFVGLIHFDKETVHEMLDDMQDKLNRMDTKLVVSFSCGIVEIDSHTSMKDAFEKADKALYNAKENGKAQCSVG